MSDHSTAPPLKAAYMRAAIDDAMQHLDQLHGGPFGACIVSEDRIVAVTHNTVLRDNDPTCHAEVNAIRAAARELGRYDLSGCMIYSTTEPCPMCFSAIHWARLDTIVSGTHIGDVKDLGFNELTISNEQMHDLGQSRVQLIGDYLRDECLGLLEQWRKTPGTSPY